MTTTQEIHLDTRGNLEIVDITEQVQAVVAQAGVTSGQLTVFVPGSTAGLTTIEYEAGAVSDLRAAIERLAPRDMHYDHDRRWGDGNGHSHVRAALLGPDLHIPIVEGRLSLGTWQQIVLVDCDNRSRHRRLIVSVMGD
ncbi:MAG TPA: secondary thiamine-phosphate synthase enzyme YjbQ [bacterium]|nr:secondary thiamine-phosphate synthase enzyme YjbQ [bacterium]